MISVLLCIAVFVCMNLCLTYVLFCVCPSVKYLELRVVDEDGDSRTAVAD